jgi:hypothetical protein
VIRILRLSFTVAVALFTVATGSVVAAPAARAQQQCVQAGVNVTPVPWQLKMLSPRRAWPLSTGAGQRVAIVGSGVADNPQLRGQLAGSVDLTGSGGSADCLGIGTGVAGIVAAHGSDTVGFHGVAPDARLLSVKVVGDRFPKTTSKAVAPDTLAAALDWSVGHGATVIVVAIPTYRDSAVLRGAVQKAQDAGILVVAATGEVSRTEGASATPYPAAYEGVLGVSAVAWGGTVARDARASAVDLVAPGHGVLTTYPGHGLGPVNGSAFATGYVAGTAALVRSYRPELSASEVAHRLLATATPAPEGQGSDKYGSGLVNPYQAVVATVSAGEPALLPPMRRHTPSAAERAREEAEAHSDALASGLAAGGAGLAVVLTAALVLGARGRRRRWRSGLAPVPADRPEDDLPEPPVELFADRQPQRTR